MSVPSSSSHLTILLAALEPSADQIGAAFMDAMGKRRADVRFIGCGGPEMVKRGLVSLFPVDDFAVMGLAGAARVFFKAFAGARDLAHLAAEEGAHAAVLIDAWAFSRIAVTRLKRVAPMTKVFKLAAPQVWATRPERTKFVADHFDGVLCLLPFEPDLFRQAGARATFVGNPNFQTAWRTRGEGARFRSRHMLDDRPILCVLPGSRQGEVKRLAPVFGETVARLVRERPDLEIVCPPAPQVRGAVETAIASWGVPVRMVGPEEKADAFAAARVALAASGTVTTELAINGAPMVVGYRVDPLTAAWARRAIIAEHVSIVNITAGRAVVPEFLQENCTADALTRELATLLDDESARAVQTDAFPGILEALDIHGAAAEKAAGQLLDWLLSPSA